MEEPAPVADTAAGVIAEAASEDAPSSEDPFAAKEEELDIFSSPSKSVNISVPSGKVKTKSSGWRKHVESMGEDDIPELDGPTKAVEDVFDGASPDPLMEASPSEMSSEEPPLEEIVSDPQVVEEVEESVDEVTDVPQEEEQNEEQPAEPAVAQKANTKLYGFLVNYDDPNGTAIEIREGKFFVTASSLKDNDLVINHPSISTPHALFNAVEGKPLMVQDLVSEEGVFVITGKSGKKSDFKKIENPTNPKYRRSC